MVLFMPPSKDTQTTTRTSSFTVFCKKVSTQKCCASFLTPSKCTSGINILQQGCHKGCFFFQYAHVSKGVSTPEGRLHTPQVCPRTIGSSMCLLVCPRPEDMSASHSFVHVPADVSTFHRCVHISQGPNVEICWTLSRGCSGVNHLSLQLTYCKFNTPVGG